MANTPSARTSQNTRESPFYQRGSFYIETNSLETLVVRNSDTGAVLLQLDAAGSSSTSPSYQMFDASNNLVYSAAPNIPASPTASQNIVFMRQQFPSTLTALVDSYIFHVRGSGQGSSTLAGQSIIRVHFLDTTDGPYLTNYTGTQLTAAGNFQTNATGQGAHPLSGYSLSPSAPFASNCALIGVTAGVTIGWNLGTLGISKASSAMNIGAAGVAVGASNSETVNVGVMGVSKLATGIGVSGYFYIPAAANPPVEPTPIASAAVYIDLGSAGGTIPMIAGYSAGVVRFQVTSNGNLTLSPPATTTGATELSITPGAVTAATAETFDVQVLTHTHTLTGGYATQRFNTIAGATITAASGLTVTTAATFAITGASIIGGSALITNNLAFWVQAGNSSFGGSIIQGHATSAINSTNTATVAQMATGYITSTSGAPTTITLPTAANFGPVIGAAQGTIFELTIDNTAGANTVTIVMGAGMNASALATAFATEAGLLTIPSGASGQGSFRFHFSSATVCTYTRIS